LTHRSGVDFFRGEALPALEHALEQGLVLLPPIVCAELLSSPLSAAKRTALMNMLADLPLHPTPFMHWADVGALRARLLRAGLSVSTPDAHVAQCALECSATLWTRDGIFARIAKHSGLRSFSES
jgi:predicted nucleic acid-binding protein